MRNALILVACTAAGLAVPAAAQQDKPQQHVRGDVTAVNGDTMDVRTRAGQVVHLKLADQLGVSSVEEADPSAIADGAFIGTTAVAQPDGTLRAVEVHVFPEAMRGAGEGHRPWDLKPGSSMTNATVSGMKKAGGARTLKLQYQGGEQTVVVPSNIPVVRLAPGDRSMLAPGAHVFVIATQGDDGTLVAQRMVVGKGGVVPPM
jgi:hypothetical protein